LVARLPHLSLDDATPEVAAALAAGPQLGVFSLMAHAQSAFRPWLRWGAALLTELELDPVLRELAILRVAAMTPGADYEWDQHEPIARGVGVTEAQIAGARTGAGLEGDAALVVRFTEQVVRDVKPTDEVWTAAAARFTPRELVELLQVIGQYMMLARIMATVEIDPDGPGAFANVDRMRDAGQDGGAGSG
jgi:alkylhydroperoxidase family enzyme